MNTTKTTKTCKKNTSLLVVMTAVIVFLAAVFFWFYQNANKPAIDVLTTDGVISQIQSLNRLQTVVYNVDTVITAQKQGNWYALWQDKQKALFVAHGRVQAGVDLNQLTADNVQIHTPSDPNLPQTATITLPAAQVFETYLDNIEVYDIDTGLFGMMDIDPQIFSQAQTSGKQQVLATACKSDILKLATDNAQKQVQSLFALANVQVTVNVVAPKSCG